MASHQPRIDPGPKEWGVLDEDVQQCHRSQVVWNEGHLKSLSVRRALEGRGIRDVHNPDDIPQDLQQHLMRAGFWHAARMRRLPIDHRLITALVERWRPETHTFHMPVGEMIVTLQDVEAILGLRTEGRVVSGYTHGNWADVITQYMGISPLAADLRHGNLKMGWLTQHWGQWAAHSATHEGQIRYTRAYLMRLFGGFLLCDKSSSVVACRYIQLLDGDFEDTSMYSWGSAVLAVLFRELCQATSSGASDIGGCLTMSYRGDTNFT
ncbi:serine/threonine-protein phosphatase 7 long form homolog [Gastrolobium bilobum]|uniref:serine/threonine-protein phosphatase 7 long form homolog n=1 Tax=Gastrolobium bilobum TaxID=150636 RepID=UPI002AAF16B5|nr:serine/threonine-protein phosphatase 7 long form homolog [Gastrolobium bilobum]